MNRGPYCTTFFRPQTGTCVFRDALPGESHNLCLTLTPKMAAVIFVLKNGMFHFFPGHLADTEVFPSLGATFLYLEVQRLNLEPFPCGDYAASLSCKRKKFNLPVHLAEISFSFWHYSQCRNAKGSSSEATKPDIKGIRKTTALFQEISHVTKHDLTPDPNVALLSIFFIVFPTAFQRFDCTSYCSG